MPLDEDIKGGHGEGEAGVEVLPDSVHDGFDHRAGHLASMRPQRIERITPNRG